MLIRLNLKSKVGVRNLLLIIGVTTIILSCIVDIYNTLMYGGIDLRNRVVASRVLVEGIEPYFFQWQPGMSDRLLDPLVPPNSIFSRVTVPPTVLVLHSLIAGFSYFQQKIIWLIVQWLSLFSIVFIFFKKSDSSVKQNLILILGWFFINSFFWRVHIERGQIYIIYVLLLTFAWYVSQLSFKSKNILSGFFVGLTASLRPPAILMFVPFLIYKKWDLLIGSIIGLLSSLFLSLIVAKFSIWQSYFFSMSGMTNVINLSQSTDNNNTDIIYPQVIEGLNNINLMNQIPHASSSIKSMFNFLGVDLTIPYMIVLGFIFIAITASLFTVSLPHKDISLNLVFLSGVTIYLVSEFFIPIGRDTYNDVQWILPLSLIVIEANTTKLLNNKLIGILFIGLLLSIGCLGWIPKFLLVSVYFIAFYVFSTSVILLRQQKSTKKYSI